MLEEWLYKLYVLKYIGYTVYTRFLLCKLAITEQKMWNRKLNNITKYSLNKNKLIPETTYKIKI